MDYCVYVYWGTTPDPLYIGSGGPYRATSYKHRDRDLVAATTHIEVMPVASQSKARRLEYELIDEFQPPFNVDGNNARAKATFVNDTPELSPALRASLSATKRSAHMKAIGRLGGLTTAASIDTNLRALTGQRAFRDRFLDGHGCKLCPTILIPPTLPAEERKRRADLLYTIHFGRMARAKR